MLLNPEAIPFEHDHQRTFSVRQQHYPLMSHMGYYHGPPPPPPPPPPILPLPLLLPPPPHFQSGLISKPTSSSSRFYHPLHHLNKPAGVPSSVFISPSTPPPPPPPPPPPFPLLPLPNHHQYHNQMTNNHGTACTRVSTNYPFNNISGGARSRGRRRRRRQNWNNDKKMNIISNASAAGATGGGTSNNGIKGTGVYWRKKFTSLMIRNIPNRLSRENLMEMVDQHCVEENKKVQEGEYSSHESSFLSEYDFLYLPMDFRKRLNLGYAFVNFTSSVAASRFTRAFENYKWEVFQTTKICQICPARIQGKDRLVGRFKNSCFKCHTDDYLPVCFTPPRNGSTSLTPPSLVGSRSTSYETT